MPPLGECQVADFAPNEGAVPSLYSLGSCFAAAVGVFHVCDPEMSVQKVIRLCAHHLSWQRTTRCIVVELTICPRCDGYSHDPCERCGFTKSQNVAMEDDMKLAHAPYKNFVLQEEGFFENARKYVDKREIRELAASIEKDGLKVPLGVIKRGDTLLVLNGSRRYRAIGLLVEEKRANGLASKVPYVVAPGKHDALSARVEGLIDNLQRKDLTSYEIAVQLHALREAGLKQAEIAAKISKSQSYVSRLLKCFETCAPAVHKAWEQNKLPDDDVQTLSKLPRPEQEKRIVKLLEHRKAAESAKPGQVRAAKSAARKAAKGTDKKKPNGAAPKPVKPSGGNLESFVELTKTAPKNNKYVRGMHDAFRYMLGELGPGEFHKDFVDFAAKKAKTDKPALPAGKRASTKKRARK